MVAPVEIRDQPASASLEIEHVFGESTVTSSFATSPMKLLAPRSRGKSVWAYTSSFGGGLVAGDQTRLTIKVGAEARGFISTQASTKIYRNPAQRACSHTTQAVLAENSLLVFAPDAVQAFAGSRYTQRQEFYLASGASLVVLDWFTSGRAARGERWEFDHYESRTDVWVAGERVFVDSLCLNPESGPIGDQHRAGRYNCFAALLFIGAATREAAELSLKHISARAVGRQEPLITSASPVGSGALVRIAGESVEQVGRELHHHLGPLSALLGDDPWARKW